MKKRLFIFAVLAASCSNAVNKPENLIGKDVMADVVADLALNNQMGSLNASGNMETQTIYIFQKHHITSKQFSESYKFYLAKPGSLEQIYDDAQNIIKNKDPEAAEYIKKQQKETQGNPALMR